MVSSKLKKINQNGTRHIFLFQVERKKVKKVTSSSLSYYNTLRVRDIFSYFEEGEGEKQKEAFRRREAVLGVKGLQTCRRRA